MSIIIGSDFKFFKFEAQGCLKCEFKIAKQRDVLLKYPLLNCTQFTEYLYVHRTLRSWPCFKKN